MFNLSFLNSGILFLAGTIIVPVLIYLFARKKPQKIIFSSIRFIKESQKNQRRKINLKNILLLLIRILIILFIIMAISRPAIKAEFLKKGTSHPKTALAIILDNSYSMDYLVDTQTEFDKAKNILHKINEIISENDLVLLFTLNSDWNSLHSNIIYGKIPQKLIDSIEITPLSSSFSDVIKLATEKIMESHLPNKELYIITDLQEQEFPEKYEIPTFFIAASENFSRDNLSCQNGRLSNRISRKRIEKKFEFEVVNQAENDQKDVICRLFLNGKTKAEKVADVPGKQQKTMNFVFEPEKVGWHSGYVQVQNERLRFDNRFYFSFYHDPSPQIAVITDSEQIPIPLQTLFEIYTNDPENIKLLLTDDLNPEYLNKFENVIVYRKKELSSRLKFTLRKFMEDNRNILFVLNEDISRDWQNFYQDDFDINFGNFHKNPERLQLVNKFHPITSLIRNPGNILIDGFRELETSGSILLQTRNFPIAFEIDNSCFWNFDPANIDNDFYLKPVFPVFLYNTLIFLSGSDKAAIDIKVGNKIKLDSDFLTLPNKEVLELRSGYYPAKQVGIYQTDRKRIAVNLDYSESEYVRIKKIIKAEILSSNWENKILQTRYGYEIWKILLILVLLLFVLEMWLVKRA